MIRLAPPLILTRDQASEVVAFFAALPADLAGPVAAPAPTIPTASSKG
ncbi:hypothetical protein NKG05_30350 [Oerskovia sp. M15]